ncbi:hypothetical protein ONS95_001838 [Cadophora gregata]|uniref:uncharacterized protein n=1 Tax=Cadophora gregata TaxID=51156 RepID=UPI0026DBD38C|nr:uncharacterized protein ONS95_001838 [Cadophora gregata]KAK0111483.1 hypothetical protein ONS95_001838 [Cadophora gregata]KAK0112041.1 hypothetical protein ONS96_001302 [Cadophora gregata f. sp. sojae]
MTLRLGDSTTTHSGYHEQQSLPTPTDSEAYAAINDSYPYWTTSKDTSSQHSASIKKHKSLTPHLIERHDEYYTYTDAGTTSRYGAHLSDTPVYDRTYIAGERYAKSIDGRFAPDIYMCFPQDLGSQTDGPPYYNQTENYAGEIRGQRTQGSDYLQNHEFCKPLQNSASPVLIDLSGIGAQFGS